MSSTPTILSAVKIPAAAAFAGGGEYDLVSLADVKLELGITDGANDAWLKKRITSASQAVSDFCNRVFRVQTYQDQIWARHEAFPWQIQARFLPLQLAHWPIASQISTARTEPPQAPALAAVAGGALAGAAYYARITYVTVEGETAPSLESRLMVPAGSLLQIASPPLDRSGLAAGWNVYVSTASFGETLQNASPLAIGEAWTLPASGLVASTAVPPSCVTVVENIRAPVSPVSVPAGALLSQSEPQPFPLAEGVGFSVDHKNGQLTRLHLDGQVRAWPAWPVIAQYQAGFARIPEDLQEAVIRLVKMRWFARNRDPMIRSENVAGVYEAQYFFGTGPGAPADMPTDIAAMLDRNYRVPVIA